MKSKNKQVKLNDYRNSSCTCSTLVIQCLHVECMQMDGPQIHCSMPTEYGIVHARWIESKSTE